MLLQNRDVLPSITDVPFRPCVQPFPVVSLSFSPLHSFSLLPRFAPSGLASPRSLRFHPRLPPTSPFLLFASSLRFPHLSFRSHSFLSRPPPHFPSRFPSSPSLHSPFPLPSSLSTSLRFSSPPPVRETWKPEKSKEKKGRATQSKPEGIHKKQTKSKWLDPMKTKTCNNMQVREIKKRRTIDIQGRLPKQHSTPTIYIMRACPSS